MNDNQRTRRERYQDWIGVNNESPTRFVTINTFLFGPIFGFLFGLGMVLMTMGGPLSDRLLWLVGGVIIVGPIWGFFYGLWMWYGFVKRMREKTRVEQLEQRVQDLESQLSDKP